MKKQYEKYGECVYVDVLRDVCRGMMGNMSFSLVFVFGVNSYGKLVVFGYSITQEKDKKTLYRILRTYFMFHGKQQKTETIFIFDNKKKGLRSALLQLIEDRILRCHIFVDKNVFLKTNNMIFLNEEKNNLLLKAS